MALVAKASCSLNTHPQGAQQGAGMCLQLRCCQTQSLPISCSAPASGQTMGEKLLWVKPSLINCNLCWEPSRSRQIYLVSWLFQGVTENAELCTDSGRGKIKALLKQNKRIRVPLKTEELFQQRNIFKCLTELQPATYGCFHRSIN